MSQEIIQQLNFTAGELTPWLNGRTDVEMRAKGAARLQNFMVTPFGGLKRRPGFEWIKRLSLPKGSKVKLYAFEHSEESQFLFLFSSNRLGIYDQDGNPLIDEDLVTPWGNEDIDLLKFQQLNDVVYCVCPNHAPYTISRYANDDWRLNEFAYSHIPYEGDYHFETQLNFKYERMDNNQYAYRVHADTPVFVKNMENNEVILAKHVQDEVMFVPQYAEPPIVSSLNRPFAELSNFCVQGDDSYRLGFQCIKRFNPATDYIPGNDNPASYPNFFEPGVVCCATIRVLDSWSITTRGTWHALFYLRKGIILSNPYDEQSQIKWHIAKHLEQSDTKQTNYNVTGAEAGLTFFNLRMVKWRNFQQALSSLEIKVDAAEQDIECRIVEVVSEQEAIMFPISYPKLSILPSEFESRNWSFGAFGNYNGYPSAVAFYQGRLWFGGTRRQPQTLWASAVDDFPNFSLGGETSDSLCLTLAASQQNKICWMSTLRGLVIGTNEGEWRLRSSDAQAINLNNVAFERQSGIGSAGKDSIESENTLYFIQKGGQKVQELFYSIEYDGFASRDVSMVASHIFDHSKILDWAFQKNVSPHIWCINSNGTLACLTINKDQGIAGWHTHQTAGSSIPLSICSIKHPKRSFEDLWIISLVQGDNDNDYYDLERMGDMEKYLDHYVYKSVLNHRVAGLLHLRNQVVALKYEGQDHLLTVSDSGTLNCDFVPDNTVVQIGMPYDSVLHTMSLESLQSMGFRKNQVKAELLLYASSLEFVYGNGDKKQTFEPTRHLLSEPYSGYVPLVHNTGISKRPYISISTSSSEAMNILGIMVTLS